MNDREELNAPAPALADLSRELVASFLHGFLHLQKTKAPLVPTMQMGKVKEIEEILLAHLTKQLPNLSEIAKQMSLSESTLKRYFKTIRGKGIYEYYLEKKNGNGARYDCQ